MSSVHYSNSVSVRHCRPETPVPRGQRLAAQSDAGLPDIPSMALPMRIAPAADFQRLKPVTRLLLPSTLSLQAARPAFASDEGTDDEDDDATVIATPETTACCFACGQDRPVECLGRKCYGDHGFHPACDLCQDQAMIAPAVAPRVIYDSLRAKPPLKF